MNKSLDLINSLCEVAFTEPVISRLFTWLTFLPVNVDEAGLIYHDIESCVSVSLND